MPSIVVTLDGIDIEDKSDFQNAEPPIVLTPDGIVYDAFDLPFGW